jgi:hypothetical protein
VEHFDSVVSRSATRHRICRDDAREAQASEVRVVSVRVVFAQELSVDLAHTIDGLGPLDGDVGCGVARRLGTERANRARYKDLELVDARDGSSPATISISLQD